MGSAQGPAVVTGAGRGIGRVIAERLAGRGRVVAAIGRSAGPLEELAAATGAVPVVLDVTDPAAVAEAWARIETDLGVPTLVVNNAGVAGPGGATWETDADAWWRVLEVNVRGCFLVARAALPSMVARGSGRLVNVASNAAFFPVWDDDDRAIGSAYMTSKAALVRLTEAIAGEVAAAGVQAFAISPGTVKTDMTAEIFATDWDDPDRWSPPGLTADLVESIDSGALDALSGRYIHAARDDWRGLPGRAATVRSEDLHTLRVRGS